MDDLHKLHRELDQWSAEGKLATFWWRDDDTRRPGENLNRLYELSCHRGIPLSLSVVPRDVQDEVIDGANTLYLQILQHGWGHANYEDSSKTCRGELGSARPAQVVLEEQAQGIPWLTSKFGSELVKPVMVPPWNKIAVEVTNNLSSIGISGLSTFAPRKESHPAPGVLQVNTHIDLLRWGKQACFVGIDRVLDRVLSHLRNRRIGKADSDEPTGVLTHHRDHDQDCWDFLDQLGPLIQQHPSAKWVFPDW